jgi:ppGpp synthetase/RelA/SpoT-type nucleotidyltranferase
MNGGWDRKMMEKVIYTKEEIESRIKVPAIVEVELKHLVEERMKQSGLYYRLFSRIKTSDSLARKFQIKSYNEEKKIQDLIGLRIDVYFEDDLRICKRLMEQLFSLVEWSESEMKDIEFKPVKINGVFRLPEYLKKQITDDTWGMCIDDTFEIQLKTVFFEGWHEIEHDMKYKGGELWSGKNSFARYFNSILATLELCDKSLVTLFENLGHDLYKEGNWAGMMKAHYRLKMEERPMYPEVEQLLNEDHSENNLGKQLFKTSRQVLVDLLIKQPRRVPINVNTIAALINEAVIHDERLTKIFHDRDVFDDGNEPIGEEMTFGRLEPLRKVTVFKALVNLSTYKYSRHAACVEAARLTYSWIYEKYSRLDGSLPKEPQTFEWNMIGFRIKVDYEPDRDYWKMESLHIDMEAPGQVWVTEAESYLSSDGRQMLSVRNSYAVAEERRDYLNRYFSCPKFYSNIADRIGLFDVRYLSTSRRCIKDYQMKKIHDLILNRRRSMPVCLIVSPENEKGWLQEEWLENFRVYDFTRMAGRYTHIYTCSLEIAAQLLGEFGIEVTEPAVYVFPSADCADEGDILHNYSVYREGDVVNCSFGRQQIKQEGRRFDIVRGGQAFYHKLVQEMRTEMLES